MISIQIADSVDGQLTRQYCIQREATFSGSDPGWRFRLKKSRVEQDYKARSYCCVRFGRADSIKVLGIVCRMVGVI